jgi:hypothetical protein
MPRRHTTGWRFTPALLLLYGVAARAELIRPADSCGSARQCTRSASSPHRSAPGSRGGDDGAWQSVAQGLSGSGGTVPALAAMPAAATDGVPHDPVRRN